MADRFLLLDKLGNRCIACLINWFLESYFLLSPKQDSNLMLGFYLIHSKAFLWQLEPGSKVRSPSRLGTFLNSAELSSCVLSPQPCNRTGPTSGPELCCFWSGSCLGDQELQGEQRCLLSCRLPWGQRKISNYGPLSPNNSSPYT